MDPRHPVNQVVHDPFDGEHLALEKAWANQPCRLMPWHFTNALVALSILAALGAVLWMFCKGGAA
jgi:hypothetical protein